MPNWHKEYKRQLLRKSCFLVRKTVQGAYNEKNSVSAAGEGDCYVQNDWIYVVLDRCRNGTGTIDRKYCDQCYFDFFFFVDRIQSVCLLK